MIRVWEIIRGSIAGKQEDILKPEGFRQNFFSILLATFAINILALSLPIMTLQIYDRILPNHGSGTLYVLIVGVCVAIVLEACLRLARSYVIGRSGAVYEHRMACIAMYKFLNADLSKIYSSGIGERLHRMSDVGKLKEFYNGYALSTLFELVFIPVFLGLIVYISGILAIVPAFVIILFAILSFRQGYVLRNALIEREHADDKRFNFLIETLEGIHTLKSYALEKFFERKYEALEEESTKNNFSVTQQTANIFNTGSVFSHLMVVCVISVGAVCVINNWLTTGALVATLLLSGRMMQPIQRALGLWARYQDYIIARKNVEELFSTPQKKILSPLNRADMFSEGRLDIQKLSFHYNHTQSILQNINLNLRFGDSILITGAHGAGKTTLLNLIAGIYSPVSGQIRIDGENVLDFTAEHLTWHVGYIRTKPLLFRGTIRDNITCFGQIGDDRAKEISAIFDVDKDVARLSRGFDTFISDNNTDIIPSGLKQRISMVRTLATKPRLILFDNADRFLDRKGYMTIYSLLARLMGKATMILVSEDSNICDLAGKRYHLAEGTLIQQTSVSGKSNIRPYQELRL